MNDEAWPVQTWKLQLGLPPPLAAAATASLNKHIACGWYCEHARRGLMWSADSDYRRRDWRRQARTTAEVRQSPGPDTPRTALALWSTGICSALVAVRAMHARWTRLLLTTIGLSLTRQRRESWIMHEINSSIKTTRWIAGLQQLPVHCDCQRLRSTDDGIGAT